MRCFYCDRPSASVVCQECVGEMLSRSCYLCKVTGKTQRVFNHELCPDCYKAFEEAADTFFKAIGNKEHRGQQLHKSCYLCEATENTKQVFERDLCPDCYQVFEEAATMFFEAMRNKVYDEQQMFSNTSDLAMGI